MTDSAGSQSASSLGDPGELEAVAQRGVDVAIVGGGINGAGIARAAARRGYSVILLEKYDYGWGTTWRSTKLIHGGLRYLEHAEIGLVFESLRDRNQLRAEYPEMVRPLRFLLPVYRGDRHRPFQIALGLTAYDLLSYRPGRAGLPRHRWLSVRQVQDTESSLRQDGLLAAFTYSDCQLAYPERLCLQTLFEAAAHGARSFDHVAVIGLLLGSGRVRGVLARAEHGGREIEVPARLVVNAAGPWVDEVLGGVSGVGRQVSGTKGAHLVLDFNGRAPRYAVYSEARADHRPFFVVPWRGHHLVGTTDARYEAPPETARAEPEDEGYLLREAQALFPQSGLSPESVLYAYAGVRPLRPSADGEAGAITRRHLIKDYTPQRAAGLLSIVGGKLSTFRSLARQAVERIDDQLGAPSEPPVARRARRAPPNGHGRFVAALPVEPSLPTGYLRTIYGPRIGALDAILLEEPELAAPLCAHGPDIAAQVVLAARSEHAVSLADALLRRTGAGWNVCLGLDCTSRAAELMARELGWNRERITHEVAAYVGELQQTFRSRALAVVPPSAGAPTVI